MFKDKYPKTVKALHKDIYVDDLLKSVDTRQESDDLMSQTEEITEHGGFGVKQWVVSGSDEISETNSKVIDTKEEKVLGMLWYPKLDIFGFKIRFTLEMKGNEYQIPDILNPRTILGQNAQVFDPYGLVIPVTLEGKLIMREVSSCTSCNTAGKKGSKKRNRWDEQVSDQIREEFAQMIINYCKIEELTFVRCVKPEGAIGLQILVNKHMVSGMALIDYNTI